MVLLRNCSTLGNSIFYTNRGFSDWNAASFSAYVCGDLSRGYFRALCTTYNGEERSTDIKSCVFEIWVFQMRTGNRVCRSGVLEVDVDDVLDSSCRYSVGTRDFYDDAGANFDTRNTAFSDGLGVWDANVGTLVIFYPSRIKPL